MLNSIIKLRSSFFLVFLFSFFLVAAQNPKIDSLKKVLALKKDTAAVNCLNAIAKEFAPVNQDSLVAYTVKAFQKAKEISYTKGCMRALMMQAGFYRRKGEVDTAMVLYNEILSTSNQSGLLQEAGEADMFIGFILQNQGEYDKSILHLISAEKNFEKVDNKSLLGRNSWMMGNIYLKLKTYNEAKVSFAKGMKYFGELKDSLGYFDCVLNTAIAHMDQKEYDQALVLIVESEKYYRKVKHSGALSASLINKSEVLVELDRLDESETALKEALELKKQLGAPLGISTCLLNMGALYQKRKDYVASEKAYTEAINLARKDNSQSIVMMAYKGLYETFKAKGEFEKSLTYHERFMALNDSIYNSEKSEIIEEMKTKFETEKKDKELVKKDAELIVKKNQQYFLFGGLGVVLIFSIFMYNRFMVTRRQKKIIEAQKYIVEEKQKAILDSIHYAKRIQKSLLPNENFLNKSLKRLRGE